MNSASTFSILASAACVIFIWGLMGYTSLKDKFPGRGFKVIQNVFKETIPFEEAIKALQEGKRIRRKSECSGFTRIIITEGKNVTTKYGTYWVSSKDGKISDYCTFSMKDVLATDWIIDE